jgi:hypothetical protein
MSTEFFNDQWRIPSNENQNKVSNYSMEFDGSNIISISPEVDLGINSTVSIWINKSVNSNVVLIGNSLVSNYLLFIEPTTIYVRINTIFKTFTNSMVLNQWYNIILVRNGDSIEVFQNGNSIGTQSGYGTTFTTKISTIGSKPNASFAYTGLVDQVAFFDYALPATGTNSVATLYGGGTAVTNPMALTPAPVYYAQLGDQSVDNGANYLVPNNSLSDYVFDFDGSNDFIDCGNDSSLQFSSSFSISAWVKINDTSNNAIISKDSSGSTGSGYHIDFRSGNQVHAWAYNATNKVIKTGLSINVWYHIVFVFESSGGTNGTQSLYVNAQTPSTNSITNFAASTVKNLRIGNSEVISGFNTNGLISNVSIFNSNLSSAQITNLYNNGSPNDISSLNPVSWWKLNAADTFDGNNWTIKDYGSGSNDGTSYGMDSSNLVVSDLQQTSGYSPYALELDGASNYLDFTETNFLNASGQASFSFWVKPSTYGSGFGHFFSGAAQAKGGIAYSEGSTSNPFYPGVLYWYNGSSSIILDVVVTENVWNHITIVFDGTSIRTFKNGVLGTTKTITAPSELKFNTIGRYKSASTHYVNGDISNFAIWKDALTSTEVTEIYNQGLPSNLNTFSGTKPTAWWQLGSNSSFNTNWTCLDEIGTNNAVSAGGMTNDDITNGVGYSANGLGTSSIDIVGDAPYSSGNGLSENQDVLDRVKDTPPT